MALNDAQPLAASPLKLAIKSITATLARIIVVSILTVATVAGGIYSSRRMIANGSPISTDYYGPWIHWRDAGRVSADPYTRAHVAKGGTLQLSSDSAGVYQAYTDTGGAYLHSSCDYIVEGPYPAGLWWSLAVFDSRGNLIANDAQRYVFTSDTVAANPDGSYIITLGRDARPGNWLPTGGAGRLVIVFTVLDPATGFSDLQRAERVKLLPPIRRENCS